MVLLGTPSQPQKALKLKKTTFWGDFRLKTAPHRRFGGSGVAEIFIFLSSNKIFPLFVKKFFFYLSPPKSYRAHQKNYHILSCSIFWHQSFSKPTSNIRFLNADCNKHLSTPWEGPRPPKSPIGSTWVRNKSFCTKIKILSSTEVENTCFLGSTSDLPKALEFL